MSTGGLGPYGHHNATKAMDGQGLIPPETPSGQLHNDLHGHGLDGRWRLPQYRLYCQWMCLPKLEHQWSTRIARLQYTCEQRRLDSSPDGQCGSRAGPGGLLDRPACLAQCSTTSARYSGEHQQEWSCEGQIAMSTACTDRQSHECRSFAPSALDAPSNWIGLAAPSSWIADARTLHCPPDPDRHSTPAQGG